MTEFEIASLGFQEANPRLAGAGLHYAELNAWSTFAYAAVSLIVGIAQCALIWWGIRQMRRASDERRKWGNDRHEEAMLALRTLIERTTPAGS